MHNRMFPRRWQRLDTGQGVQLASLDGGAPRRTPSDFGLEPEQPATVFHKGRAALVEGFSIAASTTADGFAVIANKANDLIHGGSGWRAHERRDVILHERARHRPTRHDGGDAVAHGPGGRDRAPAQVRALGSRVWGLRLHLSVDLSNIPASTCV